MSNVINTMTILGFSKTQGRNENYCKTYGLFRDFFVYNNTMGEAHELTMDSLFNFHLFRSQN